MNLSHKKSPARNLTITGLILAGILAIPSLGHAEQVTHTYDALNRLIRTDYGNGKVIDYAYDAAGNRTSQKVTVPNQPPIANAGPDQTVRPGSLVTLNGSGSSDPDNGPSPLSFAWSKIAGPAVTLTGATTAKPTFTPNTAGSYKFNLVVKDGASDSAPDSVTITVPKLGDIDGDGDVDKNDLKLIRAARKTPANGPNDLRDINGDGKITSLDVRLAKRLCTRRGCANERREEDKEKDDD